MVTLKEIAQKCNVSATTVSNILNGKAKASEETRQLVIQTVKEMGYQPNYIAQGLRNNKTRMIGIIAEDIAQFTTPEMIESMMECFEQHGYRAVVKNLRLYARWKDQWYNKDNDYHSILDPAMQDLVSMKVDGIVYIAGHARVISCFPDDFRIPAVMTYAYSGSSKVPSVAIDDVKSAYEMVRYLVEMGHRKIGVVGGRIDNIHTQKRLLGYQKALFEARVLFDPNLVVYGNWDLESGYAVVKPLVNAGCTAIFCMSDRMAGGVYDYLEEQGMKVGTDMSVASFDDWEGAAFFSPALTTTQIQLRDIGLTAAKLLVEKIEKGKAEAEKEGEVTELLIPCEMRIRNSVVRLNCEERE